MRKLTGIYLDACCLNRPFDDQAQERIRFESEAVIIILTLVEKKKVKLITSDVLDLEIGKIPDDLRKNQILSIIDNAAVKIVSDDSVFKRANHLEKAGFSGFDSLHIAAAESIKTDFFLTTDDKILKLYLRNEKIIKVNIINPIKFIMEHVYQ